MESKLKKTELDRRIWDLESQRGKKSSEQLYLRKSCILGGATVSINYEIVFIDPQRSARTSRCSQLR